MKYVQRTTLGANEDEKSVFAAASREKNKTVIQNGGCILFIVRQVSDECRQLLLFTGSDNDGEKDKLTADEQTGVRSIQALIQQLQRGVIFGDSETTFIVSGRHTHPTRKEYSAVEDEEGSLHRGY